MSEFERLVAYCDGLRAEGLSVPESNNKPGHADLRRIGKDAKVSYSFLSDGRRAGRLLTANAIAELGLAPHEKIIRLDRETITLASLRGLGENAIHARAERQGELAGSDLKQLTATMNLLIARAGSETAEALPVLESAIEAAEGALLRDAKMHLPLLRLLLEVSKTGSDLRNLPDQFGPALDLVLCSLELSKAWAARQIGVSSGLLTKWCNGERQPGSEHRKSVEALEKLLTLEPGELSSRIKNGRRGAGNIPLRLFPAEIRGDRHGLRHSRRAVAARVDHETFHDLAETAQIAELERIWREVAPDMAENMARSSLRDDTQTYRENNPRLDAQIEEYLGFRAKKTSIGGRRTLSRLSPDSLAAEEVRIRIFLGFADHYLRETKGFSDTRDVISLALCVIPELREAHLAHQMEAKEKAGYEDTRPTPTDRTQLRNAKAWFNRMDGFMRLKPEFAADLEKVAGDLKLPGDGRNQRPDDDWDHWCDLCAKGLDDLIKSLPRRRLNPGRERQDTLKPILSLDDPLEPILAGIERRRARIFALDPNCREFHTGVRGLFLLLFLVQCPLRRKTLAALTCSDREDEIAHFFKDGAKWKLKIPSALFKNRASKALRDAEFYMRELQDQWGFYEIIEIYMNRSRPYFLEGSRSNRLILTSGEVLGISPQYADSMVHALSRELWGKFAGKEFQIPGISQFGVNAFRDIVATALLKRTGDYQLAADALFDTAETVRRYYSRWLQSDRAPALEKNMGEMLSASQRAADLNRPGIGPDRTSP